MDDIELLKGAVSISSTSRNEQRVAEFLVKEMAERRIQILHR
jgi:putative aminopeptidase FrvX